MEKISYQELLKNNINDSKLSSKLDYRKLFAPSFRVSNGNIYIIIHTDCETFNIEEEVIINYLPKRKYFKENLKKYNTYHNIRCLCISSKISEEYVGKSIFLIMDDIEIDFEN